MNRSSKSIALVLISSSLILGGCGSPSEDTAGDSRRDTGQHGYGGGSRYYPGYRGWGYRSGRTPGNVVVSRPAPAKSPSGGFGSIGRAAAAGS
jgi:hypothetical protein